MRIVLLPLPHAVIDRMLTQQLVMPAAFGQAALTQDKDFGGGFQA
jgi:hypothetical protein